MFQIKQWHPNSPEIKIKPNGSVNQSINQPINQSKWTTPIPKAPPLRTSSQKPRGKWRSINVTKHRNEKKRERETQSHKCHHHYDRSNYIPPQRTNEHALHGHRVIVAEWHCFFRETCLPTRVQIILGAGGLFVPAPLAETARAQTRQTTRQTVLAAIEFAAMISDLSMPEERERGQKLARPAPPPIDRSG